MKFLAPFIATAMLAAAPLPGAAAAAQNSGSAAAAPTQAAEPHDVHRTSSFLTLPLLIGGVGLDLDELHEVLDLIAQTRA